MSFCLNTDKTKNHSHLIVIAYSSSHLLIYYLNKTEQREFFCIRIVLSGQENSIVPKIQFNRNLLLVVCCSKTIAIGVSFSYNQF